LIFNLSLTGRSINSKLKKMISPATGPEDMPNNLKKALKKFGRALLTPMENFDPGANLDAMIAGAEPKTPPGT
tara:strand:- start:522 stop:740 length:219 start_codon:yes stop_codon:yes gene_type:complete